MLTLNLHLTIDWFWIDGSLSQNQYPQDGFILSIRDLTDIRVIAVGLVVSRSQGGPWEELKGTHYLAHSGHYFSSLVKFCTFLNSKSKKTAG